MARYKAQKTAKPKVSKKKSNSRRQRQQRRQANGRAKPAFSLQWNAVIACCIGLCLSVYVFFYTEEFLDLINRIELSFSTVKAEEKSATKKKIDKEDIAALPVGKVSGVKSGDKKLTMKNASVFDALKSKRRELEKKERRLERLEEDLQKQKDEIAKQLVELQTLRRTISSKLDKKVVTDAKSVEKLVGVYSNMKPQSAATIISQLNEDLAIKILSKMKKQNAASILDFIEPGKAQILSEKYAGINKK